MEPEYGYVYGVVS